MPLADPEIFLMDIFYNKHAHSVVLLCSTSPSVSMRKINLRKIKYINAAIYVYFFLAIF